MSIGGYLVQRLQDVGIGDVFGIPGDYVLAFYSMLEKSPIRVVGCTREDCAGFAADAYARVNGIGAVCVTYCVGGLSLCNSIAGAYAEKSPVVVITGSPGLSERHNNPLLHHRVRDFRTQYEVFEKLCVAGAELSDAGTAFREIDRVLYAAIRFKRPVYLEIPRDMVNVVPESSHVYELPREESDPNALREAVAETTRLLHECQRPIIVAGVELHRFGLQDELITLAEKTGIPIAATVLGKSVVSERHPLYVGLYEGALGREDVTRYVEESDCVLLLGTFMTDINLGIYTANLDPAKCVYVTSEQLRIKHHHFHNVLLQDFLRKLIASDPRPTEREVLKLPDFKMQPFELDTNAPLTISRLIARLNEALDDKTVVIADVGDALFASTELVTHGRTEFIAPAYYTSMGFSVPAALGVQVARRDLRPIVLVGDGAFQMTCNELSNIVRNKFNAIVIVLDNKGYGTERFLHAGDFNEIHPWHYHLLPQVLGGGQGFEVRTEGEFEAALKTAFDDTKRMSLIQAHLSVEDCSPALRRLASRLSRRV